MYVVHHLSQTDYLICQENGRLLSKMHVDSIYRLNNFFPCLTFLQKYNRYHKKQTKTKQTSNKYLSINLSHTNNDEDHLDGKLALQINIASL